MKAATSSMNSAFGTSFSNELAAIVRFYKLKTAEMNIISKLTTNFETIYSAQRCLVVAVAKYIPAGLQNTH